MSKNRNTLTRRQKSPILDHSSGAGFWLWVDPRSEPVHHSRTCDQGEFLKRAIELFRTKERWGGAAPNAVKAHPLTADNGLRPVARELGLQVVRDPRVPAGAYWLGILE